MYIHLADTSSLDAWNMYVQNHPGGLPYHLAAWQKAIQEAYGFDSCSLVAEDGGRICGIFPFTRFHVPWQKHKLISLPYCDAAGVLADNHTIASALIDRALEIVSEDKCKCQIRSSEPLPVQGENITDKVRMVLELPDSADELLAGLKSKVRSQVKKPLRDGLSAKVGGVELLDHFFSIYSENMRDLGSPVHSRHWIDAVVKHYGSQALVAVVYTPDEQPAAGGILLKHPTTVVVPWASSLRRYNSLNPNMLLYWTLLSHAADNGQRYFDFGRSTPGGGTYGFKAQWGAVPKQLYWYDWPGKYGINEKTVAAESRIRKISVNCWSSLPLSLANRFGPAVRKYISL